MTWKGTAESRGYDWQWKQTRKFILARDDYLCVLCKKRGILTPATEVDHITPKAKGGTDEPHNLQSICTPCHTDKTIRENGGIPKNKINLNGEPVNADHHWNN